MQHACSHDDSASDRTRGRVTRPQGDTLFGKVTVLARKATVSSRKATLSGEFGFYRVTSVNPLSTGQP